MICKTDVADVNYCENYNEIMNTLVVLSGVVDEADDELFKPGGIGLLILSDTFGIKDDSVYVYYLKKAFTLPMLVITEMIISHYDENDSLLETISTVKKLIEYNSKKHNTKSSEQLAKNKFLKKYKSVDNWHIEIFENYKNFN